MTTKMMSYQIHYSTRMDSIATGNLSGTLIMMKSHLATLYTLTNECRKMRKAMHFDLPHCPMKRTMVTTTSQALNLVPQYYPTRKLMMTMEYLHCMADHTQTTITHPVPAPQVPHHILRVIPTPFPVPTMMSPLEVYIIPLRQKNSRSNVSKSAILTRCSIPMHPLRIPRMQRINPKTSLMKTPYRQTIVTFFQYRGSMGCIPNQAV